MLLKYDVNLPSHNLNLEISDSRGPTKQTKTSNKIQQELLNYNNCLDLTYAFEYPWPISQYFWVTSILFSAISLSLFKAVIEQCHSPWWPAFLHAKEAQYAFLHLHLPKSFFCRQVRGNILTYASQCFSSWSSVLYLNSSRLSLLTQ